MVKTPLPNNGNTACEYMHENELLVDGMDADTIAKVLEPLIMNARWLQNDDFWEDFFYRASEFGYKLFI